MSNKNSKFQKLHIRKGDRVRVLSGKDRGKEGKVQSIVTNKDRFNGEVTKKAIVEGINMVTKHQKPNQANPQGAIIQIEAPIHASNLMVVHGGSPTRISRQKAENGKGWVRVSKKTGEIIN